MSRDLRLRQLAPVNELDQGAVMIGQILDRSVDLSANRVGLDLLEPAWLFGGAVERR